MRFDDDSITAHHWLRRTLSWGVVALVAVILLARCVHGNSTAEKPLGDFDRPMAVVAATATRGDLPVFIDALGTATPSNSVLVRSRVDGQLLHVRFTEGQQVKAGDILAEIDPRPFAVLLQQAEGQLARDEALLQNARMDLARYETLWQQDSIARQELDTQRALVAQYEGATVSDRGEIASAKLQLDYATIRAPISGRVGLRQVDSGNMVRASDSTGLVLITQEQPIAVVFTIPETELAAVRRQSTQVLPIEAWDRQRSRKLADGKLLTTDNQIDTATGTIKLKAEFANKDGALFPNQFVNVRLHVDTLKNVTMIPANAIQRGSQGVFVYAVVEDSIKAEADKSAAKKTDGDKSVINIFGNKSENNKSAGNKADKAGKSKTVKLQPVELGVSSGEYVVVSAGLAPGTRVVVDGVDKLRDGAKVELIDRAASKQP